MIDWSEVEIPLTFRNEVKRLKDLGKSQEYINRWKKENTKVYRIQLNKVNDSDIIEVLENESNKAAFIKSCIREVLKTTNDLKCSFKEYN